MNWMERGPIAQYSTGGANPTDPKKTTNLEGITVPLFS
jgi:hypothetical protein